MAVNFVARKCACGGKLEFDPAKKIWICKYCGTVVEREATFDRIQVDGIEGISDVVRQTLMDVANNKMDSASENLEDCERKNHKHIGTLIANISYHLGMISEAASPEAARGYLDKVKVYAKRLNDEFPSIAEDEINLYEAFGDTAADIYANLLVVFDTLNDSGRVKYMASKLKPDRIFSVHANRNLLKIALKRENYVLAEAILKNVNHIDKKHSLQEMMLQYPETSKKTELLELLLDAQTATALPQRFYEQYFAESTDSIETKTLIIKKLTAAGVAYHAETIAKALYRQMNDYGSAKNAFLSLYEIKVSDQETEALLAFFLLENKSFEVLTAYLDVLLEKSVFLKLSSKAVISFMERAQFGADEKIHVLKRMFRFEMDTKARDAVYNYYLNSSHDNMDARRKTLAFLLTENCPISGTTVNNYIVHTRTDGADKLSVVEMIFATGINKTYLGEQLTEYLIHSQDEEVIKDKISDCLLRKGFDVDSNDLTRYITLSKDTVGFKVEIVKKLIEGGTQVRADTLDNYILSLKDPADFSEEIFNLLSGYSFTIGFISYSKYLLSCKDIDKVRHHAKLAEVFAGNLNTLQTTVVHNGNNVACNLLQAYVLVSSDHCDAARAIVKDFISAKVKLNTEIAVNGAFVKFKRYVGDTKASLSPLTLQLCEENKMFSLF